ncbi:hypothetical protein K440DRAFT_646016 [Wilcoxina mikolae CBS 423.85]|nr:hypothetical protein K440DRAFT_646016 [Wilcoxina mikolae CBS 423.85]
MKLFNAVLLALTAVTVAANPLDAALDKRHRDQYCPRRPTTEVSTTTVMKCEPTPPTEPECPAPAGQIILNPSFEDSTSGITPWVPSQQSFVWTPVTGHNPLDGSQVLQISLIDNGGDFTWELSQTMSVCASEVNFSYSVKQDNPENCGSVWVYVGDIPMSNVQPGIEWQTRSFSVVYTAPKQTTLRIAATCTKLDGRLGESMYLDAITASVLG